MPPCQGESRVRAQQIAFQLGVRFCNGDRLLIVIGGREESVLLERQRTQIEQCFHIARIPWCNGFEQGGGSLERGLRFIGLRGIAEQRLPADQQPSRADRRLLEMRLPYERVGLRQQRERSNVVAIVVGDVRLADQSIDGVGIG
jgi:hypothetical protein